MFKPGVAAAGIAQSCPLAFFAAHRNEVQAALLRVVDSGWYVLGEEVRRFEDEYAQHFGFAAAAGVGNGTDAIALALRALGVGPGDRVATLSHTAVATVAAIELVGAQPVLADIDPDTYTLDPASLERTLQAAAPVKAVIAVHLYGQPANMSAIQRVAQKFGARVLEDCSQAHGALLDGKPVGGIGDAGTFSFYPTKNLGCLGDGGMVVSLDPEIIHRVRTLREYGWERRYISEIPGMNSRLDELQAAVLRVGLTYLDAGNERRREIAAAYSEGLADTGVTLPATVKQARHVYHQYVIRHVDRDRIRECLKKQAIATNIHYPVPVHLQPAYASRCPVDPAGLKISEQVAAEILSLPMYPTLSNEEVETVVVAVRASL